MPSTILALVMVLSAIFAPLTALSASLVVETAASASWVVLTAVLAIMAVVTEPPATDSATLARKAKAVVTICWRGDISGSTALVPSSTVTPRNRLLPAKASATVVMPAALASPLTAEPAPMRTLNSPPEMVTDCCSEKSRLAAAAAVASFQIRKVTVRVAVIPLPEASTTLPL